MPERQVTWRDKLRYWFENTLSKGTTAIIGWLALLSLAIVALAGLGLAAMHIGADPGDRAHEYGFFEGRWQSMLRTLDPGVVAGDNGWQLRLLMLIVTIGGIFIVSILIGTITSGLETRLTELRKGRSRVIEHGNFEGCSVRQIRLEPHECADELRLPYSRLDVRRPREAVLAWAQDAQGFGSQAQADGFTFVRIQSRNHDLSGAHSHMGGLSLPGTCDARQNVGRAHELSDEQACWLAIDVLRTTQLLDASRLHHGDAVGHGQRFLLVVRHIDGRDL